MTTTTPTKTFTAQALTAELGRRRNNKTRETAVKPKSFVFSALTKPQIKAIIDGDVITVNFKSGRTEHVGLKATV